MKIYNTLGRAVEDFAPNTPGRVSMYVCGATVQSGPHVGHGRFAVVFDVVRRYLEWRGYDVEYVVNVTDIDDKIIKAANEEGVPITTVVERATAEFDDAFDRMRVLPPTIRPRATEHIPEMQALIGELIDKGHAYASDGDVYFSVRSFEPYGKLSGRDIDELVSGARIEPGDAKRDPLDFALWKGSKPGEPSWDSPWGPGRPGWHIECSAMAAKYLGQGFDIHAGGLDLVFPHHENEIAQSEAATGEPFARLWMHNGMVNLSGEKMAKSTGHVIDLARLTRDRSPLAIRFFLLRAHYRKPIDFTDEALADAEAALDRLWAFRRRVPGDPEGPADPAAIESFVQAMDDDFDTAAGLSVLFEVVREGNRLLDAGADADGHVAAYDEIVVLLGLEEPVADVEDIARELRALATEMGVDGHETATESIDALMARRAEARAAREWAVTDAIRDRLAALGIVVEDTAEGARWHRR